MRYIYGPVLSARLGLSLGVDIVPPKTCCYDCIYCQQGRTTCLTFERREFIPADEVIAELKDYFLSPKEKTDYVTISGSGEPTLNERLGDIIETLKSLTETPVAVLTNGALLTEPAVSDALLKADMVIPTLTSVKETTHRRIHRPAARVDVDGLVHAFTDFKRHFDGRFEVEVMVLSRYNDTDEEIEGLRDALAEIAPDSVQMNTVRRPPSSDAARPVPIESLRRIGERLGVPFSLPERKGAITDAERLKKEEVLEVVTRRPMSVEELADSTGMSPTLLSKIIAELLEEGSIVRKRENDREFIVYRRDEDGRASDEQ